MFHQITSKLTIQEQIANLEKIRLLILFRKKTYLTNFSEIEQIFGIRTP